MNNKMKGYIRKLNVSAKGIRERGIRLQEWKSLKDEREGQKVGKYEEK